MSAKYSFLLIIIGIVACFSASNAQAQVPEYDTISPINLTINYHKDLSSDPVRRKQIETAIHHWAVGTYVMTDKQHRLGRINIIQRDTNAVWTENAHLDWRKEYWKSKKTHADADLGTYVPHSQNGKPQEKVRISDLFLDDRTRYDENPNITPNPHTISFADTGYTLTHEIGHFIYGIAEEYSKKGIVASLNSWYYTYQPRGSDKLHAGVSIMDNDSDQAQKSGVYYYRRNDAESTILPAPVGVQQLAASTSYNYGWPLYHPSAQTGQRRLYPNSVSAWKTMTESEPRSDGGPRSRYMDLKAPPTDKPAPVPEEYEYTFQTEGNTQFAKDGLPGIGPQGKRIIVTRANVGCNHRSTRLSIVCL